MKYEFLDKFERRMKNVGLYAVLFKNSFQKGTWKQYGFERMEEQINLIFTVLLYIMEQSLKEEVCTMDDIASFVDSLNMEYYKKRLGFLECKELSDFIINVILCDEGKAMYFDGFNYKEKEFEALHISFVQNRVVYIEGDTKRTSYSLTGDGYSMMLSTLELEGNMKLTIHEMIFKLHLEKATYDKAVEDVKNIFNELRIRLQNMQDAMAKIRRNALDYSVDEYRRILKDNMNSLDQTNTKYEAYRQNVLQRVKELEEKDIDLNKLSEKDLENLSHLKNIEQYLGRAIDELQKLMITHFDLKNLYAEELESMSQMSMVKRFSLRTQVYEEVLNDVSILEGMDQFLRPLLSAPVEKIYNVNKAFQTQRLTSKEEDSEDDVMDFDEDSWEEERREKIKRKLLRYRKSLTCILKYAKQPGGITLKEMKSLCDADEELRQQLIPSVEVFREVVIELLKGKSIDVDGLRQEQSDNIVEQPTDFQLNVSVLEAMKEEEGLESIHIIGAKRLMDEEAVCFEHIPSEDGKNKRILCSNVRFEVN